MESLQNEGIPNRSRGTAEEVAKAHGLSTVAVERAVRFSRGLDAAEAVSPGIKKAVLYGDVKAPKNIISEIRNLPEEHLPAAVEAIRQGNVDDAKKIIKASKPVPEKESETAPVPVRINTQKKCNLMETIKLQKL